MHRSLAMLAVPLVLALAPAALANPSVTVTSARDGTTASLPAKVKHRLTLTAGAVAERVTVEVSPSARLTVGGDAQSVVPPVTGVGPSLATCSGRWQRFHNAFRGETVQDEVTLTLAPGATAFVEATVTLARAPWIDESLEATWFLEPAEGRGFTVVSAAPNYNGPYGVELAFQAVRAPDGHYVVAGSTEPAVDSGHVEVWAYAPGRKRATRLARVRVRGDGTWAFNRFMPDRRGRWELYARYRTAGRGFANDVSECGTFVRVR